MDWTPTDMQDAVRSLAAEILAGDGDPWPHLAQAELLALDDALDTCTLLVEAGRRASPAPVLETLVLGAPLRRALPDLPVDTVLTGALAGGARSEEGRLSGRCPCVPAVDRAAWAVIPTQQGLFVVRPADCAPVLQQGTDDRVMGILTLDDVPAEQVGDAADRDAWYLQVDLGIAALQLGLAQEALAMTARYVTEREQFGRPIGTFQAVSQRAADAWIQTRAMELTLWQAAWRLHRGLPAAREVAIARFQAAEGSHQVLAAAQHLHGGMGFDRDYPLHRYFLTSKAWEFARGGASAQLERLGDLLADEAAG